MTLSELFPAYKECARQLSELEEGEFVPDVWFEKVLREKRETDAFRFQFMHLNDELLDVYQVGLLRTTNNGNKGYRIANDEEKVKILSIRNKKRMFAALHRQRRVLLSVKDVNGLDEETRQSMDRQLQENAFTEFAARVGQSRRLAAAHAALKQIDDGED